MNLTERLSFLQQRCGERLLSVMTLLLALMLFFVAPLQAAGVFAFPAFGIVVALFMIGGTMVISAIRAAYSDRRLRSKISPHNIRAEP